MEQHSDDRPLLHVPRSLDPLGLATYKLKYHLETFQQCGRWYASGRECVGEAATEVKALDRLARLIQVPSYVAWKLSELRKGQDE
jgi:hypothetical protein